MLSGFNVVLLATFINFGQMTSIRHITLILLVAVLFTSCEKNTMSKIPYISLIEFVADSVMQANMDTCFFYFSLEDGDADIAVPGDSVSQIYLKDSRDPDFIPMPFPTIDPSILDPKKGIKGTCLFYIRPLPKVDTLADTLNYEFYIKDKAGHESNHLVTPRFIVRP